MSKKLLQAAVVLASIVNIQAAQAGLVNCPSSFTTSPTAKVEDSTGLLNAASACQYLTPPDNSNVASVANINAAGFFGTSNWTANGSNVQVAANNSTGTWSITGADFLANDYAIVFKSGKDTNLVGFLFNELFSNGVWSTPFTDPPFDFKGKATSREVSDYTIVQRNGEKVPPGGGEVPEPGILALMGLGMAGFVATRRRSSRK